MKCFVMFSLLMDVICYLVDHGCNHVIYNGYDNTYSLKHNKCSLTLTLIPPPKPLIIESRKEREKSLHKSKTRDESATIKSKSQIALLMVK